MTNFRYGLPEERILPAILLSPTLCKLNNLCILTREPEREREREREREYKNIPHFQIFEYIYLLRHIHFSEITKNRSKIIQNPLFSKIT